MTDASLSKQGGRRYRQFSAIGRAMELPSVGTTAGVAYSATSDDLTTLLRPHLDYLRTIDTPNVDESTLFAFDIPTVRAAESSLDDLNSQYFVYLHTHQ